MSKPELISNASQISPAWLNQAFRAGGAEYPEVTRVTTSEAGVDQGVVSDLARCHLTFAEDLDASPETVIVKLASSDPAARKLVRRLELQAREYTFYRRLGEELRQYIPRVFYADYDAETEGLVIVQEDLADKMQVDQVTGATAEQALSALRSLTAMHVQFLGRTRDACFNSRVWRKLSSRRYRELQAAYLWFLPSVRLEFRDQFSHGLYETARELGCALPWFWRQSYTSTPLTFTHGDFRLDNLFFDCQDPDSLKMIDWQICSIGSGMRDVAYFLATNLEPEVRRSIERDAVAEYGAAMAEAGVSLEQDSWWLSYRLHALGNFLYCVMAAGGFQKARGQARTLLSKGLSRAGTTIEDLDAGALLPTVGSSPVSRLFWLGFHGVARGAAGLGKRS